MGFWHIYMGIEGGGSAVAGIAADESILGFRNFEVLVGFRDFESLGSFRNFEVFIGAERP